MSDSQSNYFVLPALTLWWREMVRFFRQRDRVVGALVTPIVFWLLLGFGLGKSFKTPSAPEGHGYLEYFFAGTLVMILLFTAIFSTISVIEDRREGFLQAVLVAPVGRFAIVLGKILGGTTLAFVQGLLFLVLAPLLGLHLSVASLAWLAVVMFLISFALDRTGICHRLADEFNARFPCDHESVSDSTVAVVGRCVSFCRARRLAGVGDEGQPAQLRSDGVAGGIVLDRCHIRGAMARFGCNRDVRGGHVCVVALGGTAHDAGRFAMKVKTILNIGVASTFAIVVGSILMIVDPRRTRQRLRRWKFR